jgi:hypothetical protein
MSKSPSKGLPKSPLTKVQESGAVAEATPPDKRKAGKRQRKTLVLEPGWIPLVARLAEENGVGILAMWRWLIARGLAAYEAGERPVAKVVAHEVEYPESGQ